MSACLVKVMRCHGSRRRSIADNAQNKTAIPAAVLSRSGASSITRSAIAGAVVSLCSGALLLIGITGGTAAPPTEEPAPRFPCAAAGPLNQPAGFPPPPVHAAPPASSPLRGQSGEGMGCHCGTEAHATCRLQHTAPNPFATHKRRGNPKMLAKIRRHYAE